METPGVPLHPPNWVFFPDVPAVEKLESTSEATWPADPVSFSKYTKRRRQGIHTLFGGLNAQQREQMSSRWEGLQRASENIGKDPVAA